MGRRLQRNMDAEFLFERQYMENKDLSLYRDKLTEKRARLLQQIAAQRGGTVSRADSAAEQFSHREDSDAQVATERDLNFAIDEHETAELMLIEAALARLDQGSYGECDDCGIHIPPARLQVSPEAARCVKCQEKLEKTSHSR